MQYEDLYSEGDGERRGVVPTQYLRACRMRRSPLHGEEQVGVVECGPATTSAGGHGGQEIWRRKRGSLFAKESIFIHLYLLNETKEESHGVLIL